MGHHDPRTLFISRKEPVAFQEALKHYRP